MKIKKLSFFIVALLFISFIPTNYTQALGFSPAEQTLTMLTDTKQNVSFTLTRHFPLGESTFTPTIRNDEAQLIKASSVKKIIAPSGEYETIVTLAVDTTDTQLGTYSIDFVYEEYNATNKSTEGSVPIRQGVGGSITVNVVDKLIDTVSLSDSPELYSGISISNVHFESDDLNPNNPIVVKWDMINSNDVAVSGYDYSVVARVDGTEVTNNPVGSRGTIQPGETKEISHTLNIDSNQPGAYAVTIALPQADSTQSIDFTWSKLNSLVEGFTFTMDFYSMLIIALAIFIIISGVLVAIKSKRARSASETKGIVSHLVSIKFKHVGYVGMATLCIILLVSYYSVPKLSPAGDDEPLSGSSEFLIVKQSDPQTTNIIRLGMADNQQLDGDWNLYHVSNSQLYASLKIDPSLSSDLEEVLEDDKETKYLFMISSSAILKMDPSDLPGDINYAKINNSTALTLINGQRSEDQEYWCVTGTYDENGLDCVFLDAIVGNEEKIVSTEWDAINDNIYISTDKNSYAYNYWNNKLSIDRDAILSTDASTQDTNKRAVESQVDSGLFYTTLGTGSKKYRLPFQADILQVNSFIYLMKESNSSNSDLFLINSATGKYYNAVENVGAFEAYLLEENT